MTTARHLHYSYEDYLSALEMSEIKLEFLNGEIFAMAGGTPAHSRLSARMIHLLSLRLGSGCSVMTSGAKVRIRATGLSTFPDVSVVCGELESAPDDKNSIANPKIIVEILSPSTEEYDRGEKLRHYQQLPSLQCVLLVAHDAKRVTVVTRAAAGWSTTEHTEHFDVADLGSFAVSEVYG